MKLVWRASALNDLRRLKAFIAPANPKAAVQAIQTIRASVKMLESFPNMGRKLPAKHPLLREWIVNFGASTYVVRYRVGDRDIAIIAVRHGFEADDKG